MIGLTNIAIELYVVCEILHLVLLCAKIRCNRLFPHANVFPWESQSFPFPCTSND